MRDDVRIARAEPDDAEAITDLLLECWEEAYADLMPGDVFTRRRQTRDRAIEGWRGILTVTPDQQLSAWAGSRLVGLVSVGPARDDAPGLPGTEVMAMYVRAELHGQGVAQALLGEALGPAAAYLWVLDGNSRATAFYRRQGFAFDGCERVDRFGTEQRMVRNGPPRPVAD